MWRAITSSGGRPVRGTRIGLSLKANWSDGSMSVGVCQGDFMGLL